MSLSRHTAYNLAGQLLPLGLSLLTIPVYLQLIGEARFGALALLWLFFGYAGLFDLGIGQASARQLAACDAGATSYRARLLRTAIVASLLVGTLAAAAAALVGLSVLEHYRSIDDSLRVELTAALPWATALVPMVALGSVLTGALQARSAFAEINIIGVLTSALLLLAPLGVAVTAGPELGGLALSIAITRAALLLLLLWRCRAHYPRAALHEADALEGGASDTCGIGRVALLDRKIARGLIGFGGWTTVSAVAGPLLVVLDRFLIGAQLGAKAVSHYVIPFQLAERATALSSALGYALFPRLASSAHEAERHALAMRSLRVLAIWTTAPVALGLLLAGPFLAWWISPDLAARSTTVAQVLLVAFWISSLATVPYTKLLASGRPDLVAKCHLAQLMPYVAVLYVALQSWGLIGAAIAFAARVLADFLMLAHWARVLGGAHALLAWPAALLLGVLAVASTDALSAAGSWVAGAGLIACLALWTSVQATGASLD